MLASCCNNYDLTANLLSTTILSVSVMYLRDKSSRDGSSSGESEEGPPLCQLSAEACRPEADPPRPPCSTLIPSSHINHRLLLDSCFIRALLLHQIPASPQHRLAPLSPSPTSKKQGWNILTETRTTEAPQRCAFLAEPLKRAVFPLLLTCSFRLKLIPSLRRVNVSVLSSC